MKIRNLFRLFISITAAILCLSIMANAREHRLIDAIPESAPTADTGILSSEEPETPDKNGYGRKSLPSPKKHRVIFTPTMRW